MKQRRLSSAMPGHGPSEGDFAQLLATVNHHDNPTRTEKVPRLTKFFLEAPIDEIRACLEAIYAVRTPYIQSTSTMRPWTWATIQALCEYRRAKLVSLRKCVVCGNWFLAWKTARTCTAWTRTPRRSAALGPYGNQSLEV
jgi:hypothetical protein